MIIEFSEFEKYKDKLNGIFVGGCVARGEGSSFRRRGHTHTTGIHKGWICIRSMKRVYMNDGVRPSNLILHELAHALVPHRHWHDEVWMAKLRELGGAIHSRYKDSKGYQKFMKRSRRFRKAVETTMTESARNYMVSKKGREAAKRYRQSAKGKAAAKRYLDKKRAESDKALGAKGGKSKVKKVVKSIKAKKK